MKKAKADRFTANKLIASLLCALIMAFSPAPRIKAAVSTDPAGHWEGAITREGKQWRVWIDISSKGESFKGTIDLPDYGLYALPMSIKVEGARAQFNHFVRDSAASFDGQIAGDEIAGEWKGLQVAATFKLRRMKPQPVVAYVEEEIRFQNGDATLVGTLIKPDRPGRHPAIVFTHGSGNQTRTQSFYRSRAYLFARHGIAALIYDRRGQGASTGTNANFPNMADDAVAGVRALRARRDIDPSRVGVSGFSQGGWVSPLAAARSQEIAFVLVGSAPAITVDEQNDFTVENALRARGLPEEKTASVLALRKRLGEFLHTARGDKADLQNAINALKSEQWFRDTQLPSADFEPYNAESKAFVSFDPAPVWEKVKAPVLAVWGAQDAAVPAEKSRAIIERALGKAGNRDYTLRVFPKAVHGLAVFREKGEAWDWPRLAPGYQELMIEWLLKRVSVAK